MSLPLLSSLDMARFTARGFLRFDGVVPDTINQAFLEEAGSFGAPGGRIRKVYGEALAASSIPEVAAGTPLAQAYPDGSALKALTELPLFQGVVRSLLGANPIFDHHFLHVTLPPAYHEAAGGEAVSQHTHQDSTVDPRLSFDVQVMYYPHEVTRPMGGTRFIPGTHLRKVSEVALGRYQNIRGQQHMVCEAGTLLFLHHGIWHGGGVNHADRTRSMFKIRMRASGKQTRNWDTSDLKRPNGQRPIYFIKGPPDPDTVEAILMAPEPWFEQDTGRLEMINRVKLWRYLTEDPDWDVDYWMTRLEGVH